MRPALLAALLFMACTQPVYSGGMPVHPKLWEPVKYELTRRAAVDLGCYQQYVELTLLKKEGKAPTLVFAQGCGRSAIYSRALRHHFGHRTTANTQWDLEALDVSNRHEPVVRAR